MSRNTTQVLLRAAIRYLVHYRYSVFDEFGLVKKGLLRSDVVGFNMST